MDATSVLDPVRPPAQSLTDDELNEIAARIEAGELPADYLRRHKQAVRDNVFGVGHAVDKAGRPVEQGLGSAFQQTRQSIDAFKKYHANDVNFERDLAVLEKQLLATEQRKKSEAPGADQAWRKHV
jgi:hypothetical protein